MPSQTRSSDDTGLLSDARRAFGIGRTSGLPWRLDQLRGIERLCGDREAEITAALAEDLGRSLLDAWLGDIASTKSGGDLRPKALEEVDASWELMNDIRLELAELTALGSTERSSD
jgi:aldehyde dehydrogenase (NAD+)